MSVSMSLVSVCLSFYNYATYHSLSSIRLVSFYSVAMIKTKNACIVTTLHSKNDVPCIRVVCNLYKSVCTISL